jgi:hypothetical protein
MIGVALTALAIGLLIRPGDQAPRSPVLDTAALSAEVLQGLDSTQEQGAVLFVEKGCLGYHQIGSQGGQRGPTLPRSADASPASS